MNDIVRRIRDRCVKLLGIASRADLCCLDRSVEKLQTSVGQLARNPVDTASQKLLYATYRSMAARRSTELTFDDVGFRCHSECDEDGILLYLFGMLGVTNRKCVELCAGNGRTCNTANLIRHHGWWGWMFDGDPKHVASGNTFYASCPDTRVCPPVFQHAWITAENVNALLADAGVSGSIDLLSLDLDGVDYWIWKSLEVIRPRVVVCEVHNIIPPELALTVPYTPDFVAPDGNYRGASLAAMNALAIEKGYRLVGVHRYGFNAFFVRADLGGDFLPEPSVASCLQDPFTVAARANRWPLVEKMPWVRVS